MEFFRKKVKIRDAYMDALYLKVGKYEDTHPEYKCFLFDIEDETLKHQFNIKVNFASGLAVNYYIPDFTLTKKDEYLILKAGGVPGSPVKEDDGEEFKGFMNWFLDDKNGKFL